MPIKLEWSAETPNLFAAKTEDAEAHARIFLVVETMPAGGWEWAAWSSCGRHNSLHGHAPNREAATQKAELAARAIRIAQAVEAM